MPKQIDVEKFFSDPEFQGDRDLMNAAIDRRLTHHAEEAKKKKPEDQTFLQRVFDGLPLVEKK